MRGRQPPRGLQNQIQLCLGPLTRHEAAPRAWPEKSTHFQTIRKFLLGRERVQMQNVSFFQLA